MCFPIDHVHTTFLLPITVITAFVVLIVIFVLQTIILPLAFLWLFVEGLKGIASRATRISD